MFHAADLPDFDVIREPSRNTARLGISVVARLQRRGRSTASDGLRWADATLPKYAGNQLETVCGLTSIPRPLRVEWPALRAA